MKPSDKEKPWQDKETLRQLYEDELMSQQDIADHFDNELTGHGIKYWLEKHGIEKRSRAEAAKLRWLKEVPNMHTHETGYEFWRDHTGNDERLVLVHRLLAVAVFGFDAVADKVVHHKNNVPWDNRPENIEIMTVAEHAVHHHNQE